MKKLLIIAVTLLFGHTLHAQSSLPDPIRTIPLNMEHVTQVLFPSKVVKFRTGSLPNNFFFESYDNLLYIQPLKEFQSSNLSVITENGEFFDCKIQYSNSATSYSHIFKPEDAFYRKGAADVKTTPETISTSVPVAVESPAIPRDSIAHTILDEKWTVTSRNAAKYKSLLLSITGIYIHRDMIYLRLNVNNKSAIPYNFDYIGFQKTNKAKHLTSINEESLTPLYSYYSSKTVGGRSSADLVFGFPKFTLGEKNFLEISIIEGNGARNLTIEISDDILLNAKPIKLN